MKRERVIALSTFLCFLVVGLNIRLGSLPPLGKFLSPFTGFIQNSYDAFSAPVDAGLSSPVRILFDERRVPHIFAGGEEDLYFAQGLMHARDRLWQMDFLYRAAAGRLSEVAGAKTVGLDRITRRKGLPWAAENTLDHIKKNYLHTFQHLQAYSRGVNYWIEHLQPKDYPVEFKLMDYKPEKWSPLKTIMIQKYMANMLAGGDNDVERTNALSYFGQKDFERLFSNKFQEYAPMIDSGECAKAAANQYKSRLASTWFGASKSDPYQPEPGYGSNSWVISGNKTNSGYPVLASDPHLELTLPSIWYELQLSGDKSNAYGVSIPGVPYIIIGFNKDIAWGITNGETDVRDWYALKFRNNRSEYYLGGKWMRSDLRIEKIAVFNSADVTDTVLLTLAGPVVYTEAFNKEPDKCNMALNWTAHLPSNDFNMFYLLNRGKEFDDFKAAIRFMSCPTLNVTFASKEDIAIAHQGKIPYRQALQGQFVFDGAKTIPASQYIAQEDLPLLRNPEKNFVFSANQKPVPPNYPLTIYGYYGAYRNRTIETDLKEKSRFAVKDVMKMQTSNFDLFAAETLPVMLHAIQNVTLTPDVWDYIHTLRAWNYYSDRHLTAPLLFSVWWEEFHNQTWDDLQSLPFMVLKPNAINTLKLMKDEPSSKYFDLASTPEIETAPDVLMRSLKVNVERLSSYRKSHAVVNWSEFKNTTFRHLLNVEQFSRVDVYSGGSKNSINATTTGWGPSWRMIVTFDPGKPRAWGINPGGQSGNPGSAWYASNISDWAEGKYHELSYMQDTSSACNYKIILK